MAMRVDEARQQNDFAEVNDFPGCAGPQIRPRTDSPNAVSGNEHRAVFNRRLRNRQNNAGAENHGKVTGGR
jgi:hypothetical protein